MSLAETASADSASLKKHPCEKAGHSCISTRPGIDDDELLFLLSFKAWAYGQPDGEDDFPSNFASSGFWSPSGLVLLRGLLVCVAISSVFN